MPRFAELSLRQFGLFCFIALALRLYLASWGGNFDMDSWQIVADIVVEGDLVYAETQRYNYGPIWFCILGALKQLQLLLGSSDTASFHFYVAGFLALIDIGLATLLRKHHSKLIALLFLFNPVSIFLTGYHSQFENLAVLWAFIAWLFLQKEASRYYILSAAFLAISLIQKHLFVFFPIWIFFGKIQLTWKQKTLYCVLVYGLFISVFLPFMGNELAWQGIRQNVFGYSSSDGIALIPLGLKTLGLEPFIQNYLAWIPILGGYKFFFFLSISAIGLWVMRQMPQQGFYLYLMSMVFCSSAIVDQYWAIPLIAFAVYYRYVELWICTGLIILYLIFRSTTGLGLENQAYFEWGGMLGIKKAILSHYAFQLMVGIFLIRYFIQNYYKKKNNSVSV